MKIHSDSVTNNLFLFALPMLVGNMLQSCYNMVDMAIVGQYVGRDALAAVSNTAMICFISNSICIGFTIGGNVLVAKYRGAQQPEQQRETVETLFALSALGGIALTMLNYALYKPMLVWMGLPTEAMPYALDYMHIIWAGNVFVFGYNAACAVMRGLGDSRRPVYCVAVAAAVNIGLDYLFVGAFHWGVGGAAIATVVAQAVSCIVAVDWLRRRLGLLFPYQQVRLRVSSEKLASLVRLGLPTALQSAVLNISYIVITALFNQYGTAVAAAAGVGLKVNTFVAMPCWAVGQAVTTMAGYSMGARRPELAAAIARKGMKIGLLFTSVLLVLIHLFVRPFLGVFSNDPDVLDYGVMYLRICCFVNFIPYVVMYILNCFAVGVDAPFFAMANSLLQSVVIRLGLSFVLAVGLHYGFIGLCIAESVSPVIPCIIGTVFFRRGIWRRQ